MLREAAGIRDVQPEAMTFSSLLTFRYLEDSAYSLGHPLSPSRRTVCGCRRLAGTAFRTQTANAPAVIAAAP